MITEDYVSFETGKHLREKGFDEECNYEYGVPISGQDYFLQKFFRPIKNSELIDEAYTAPTLQMTMKWLRKNHGFHCSSDYDFILGWYCQITSLKETVEYDYEEMKHYHPDNDHGFSSPEEACEAAIKYCLENLI